MDELKIEMTVYMLNEMNQKLMHRLIGKSGYDAIREYASVYKEFALKIRQLINFLSIFLALKIMNCLI